jgi:hypothetical protein
MLGKFDSKTKQHHAEKQKDPCLNRSSRSSRSISKEAEDHKVPQRMKPPLGMKSSLLSIGQQGKHGDRRKGDARERDEKSSFFIGVANRDQSSTKSLTAILTYPSGQASNQPDNKTTYRVFAISGPIISCAFGEG